MRDLATAWRAAARGAGATADDHAVDAEGSALLARWAEPHRHYHTLEHLATVLSIVDEEADRAREPDLVRLAAWFHDAVYDPHTPGDGNERASAELAVGTLVTLGVPTAAIDTVRRLVLLTAGHAVPAGDADGALLCDADLAVLAGQPAAYDAYAAAVRQEYEFVPDAEFRAGRAAILRRLLELPSLYRIPELAERWNEPARANLIRELGALDR
ncbi:metal-dependent phosphohydrolase [Asanoa sp. WMMD1127]|uniref:HD domain-containing protein n=1 Tax=Asanoa sp. WMMD1127 TaxID=3016107 RepID=UPI002416A486|nr:metal-dependent phosphohydrolase [Asanoa sp. WMMD1127]MDG4822527.1 metal-dependent phosphohydrolase [Asanoa sp. WMMD1127]